MAHEQMGRIYLLTCMPSSKIYVGQTTQDVSVRFSAHVYYAKRGARTHLALAITKYGAASFSIQILEECPIDSLNAREIFYVRHLRANDRSVGYNMSEGGDGGRNSLSEEVRQKISFSKRGKRFGPLSEERKIKISLANKGKRRTAEQRLRIRDSRPYPPLSTDHKDHISVGLRRTRSFSLPEYARADVLQRIQQGETDASIAGLYGVSRKMIWRFRHDISGCASGSITR